MPNAALFTLQEVAEIFGVKYTTVRRWLKEKQFEIRIEKIGAKGLRTWVMPDELVRLFNSKYCIPGDGSPADKIYQWKYRKNSLGGKNAWINARAKGFVAKGRAPSKPWRVPKTPENPLGRPMENASHDRIDPLRRVIRAGADADNDED
jgi:hypothetical protein